MKASAPNLLAVGSHVLEKIPLMPSVVNHDEDCWLVETTMRTRITSTSRPATKVMSWKLRSPSGRFADIAPPDPAVPAGSGGAVVVTRASRSDQRAKRCSTRQAPSDLPSLPNRD